MIDPDEIEKTKNKIKLLMEELHIAESKVNTLGNELRKEEGGLRELYKQRDILTIKLIYNTLNGSFSFARTYFKDGKFGYVYVFDPSCTYGIRIVFSVSIGKDNYTPFFEDFKGNHNSIAGNIYHRYLREPS